MEIKKTKDFDRFTTITGNRNINSKKVKDLVDDIKNGINLLPYYPILVYCSIEYKSTYLYKIVDGQHRFEAARLTDNYIYFIEGDKLDLKQIARLNSRSDKWKNKDFLNCYIELGNENYVTLKNFMNKYHLIYSAAIYLLMAGKIIAGGSNIMEKFRNGEFKVNHYKTAEKIVSLTYEIFGRYVFANKRGLIAAIHDLYNSKKCDFEVLKSKIKQDPNGMSKQPSKKEYLYNIEKVYNYGNSKRVSIF